MPDSQPPAESNPRSPPYSDGSGDGPSVPQSPQQSAETESCLVPGTSAAAAVDREDQIARDESTVSTLSILRVIDHDAPLGEAAGPQMVSTVNLSGNAVENTEQQLGQPLPFSAPFDAVFDALYRDGGRVHVTMSPPPSLLFLAPSIQPPLSLLSPRSLRRCLPQNAVYMGPQPLGLLYYAPPLI
jgi:hypothetical protein